MSPTSIRRPGRRGLLAASLLSCVLGCGGSPVVDSPWGWPPLAPRDTIVAQVEVAPGTRVRALMLDDKWRSGTVTGIANDTLHLADDRPAVPLRGLQVLQVNTGERVHSASRIFAMGLGGFLLGGVTAAGGLRIVDPSGEYSPPDACYCTGELAWVPVAAGVGAVLGMVLGSRPVDRWVTIFPERHAVPSPSWSPPRLEHRHLPAYRD